MLSYLKNTYGEVAKEDGIAFKIHLNVPYRTATSVNDYFSKIEDIQEMSASDTIPISNTALIAQIYTNIKSTDIYDNNMERGMTK